MATKGNTNPERIARWKVLAAGLKPQIAGLPYLGDLLTQLEAATMRAEELDARSEALKAESREVNRLREEVAKTGDDLRNRLGASLKTLHGFSSEKLIEFGLTPRKPRGRDRKPRVKRSAKGATPPETPATAAHAAEAAVHEPAA